MRLRLDEDGIVVLFTGQMPHGQSHQTTLAQIAADEFGVPFEQVRVVVGDTDVVPSGLTGGSRSATMAGGATLHGARQLKAKVLDFASRCSWKPALGTSRSPMAGVWVRGDPRQCHRGERGRAGGRQRASSVPTWTPTSKSRPRSTAARADGRAALTAPIVEVDIETGLVAVERYVVAEDCGALINPAVVDGQIRGGVAQGIGAVLLERSAYDEDGNFQSATFMDYLMPTACDIPRIEIEHLRPCRSTPTSTSAAWARAA